MHFSAVLYELILARKAVAFSVVLASDYRADELGGILAVPGGCVADEVRPALRAEAAALDSAGEWGFGVFITLSVMGLLMESTIARDQE